MDVSLSPGTYVLAVSGGVDSVVLLDMMSQMPDLQFVVAHFDHGMRGESSSDAKFVENLASKYRSVYELGEAKLGHNASEATARKARYDFLLTVMEKHGAKAIITAHHQDDLLETMIINLLRGTQRKGLSSLKSSKQLLRPLLGLTKKQLIDYAKDHNLKWREDSTNADTKYLRNFVRLKITPKLTKAERGELLKIQKRMININNEVDQEIATLLQNKKSIKRSWLLQFDHKIACELIAEILRRYSILPTQERIERIIIAAKVNQPGAALSINRNYMLKIGKTSSVIKQK